MFRKWPRRPAVLSANEKREFELFQLATRQGEIFAEMMAASDRTVYERLEAEWERNCLRAQELEEAGPADKAAR